MTKKTMIKHYRNHSASEKYIVGFEYNKDVYFVEVNQLKPKWLKVEDASRNNGKSLRVRLNKATKQSLLKKATKLCKYSDLIDNHWNVGEMFEKLVTESYYKQTWKKDNTPYWTKGDITIDNIEIQIKFDSATLTNTKQIEKLKKRS